MNGKFWRLMLLAVLFMSVNAIAQSGKLPPFQMMQVNNNLLRAQDLPMDKPIVIVYFSPGCDHCEALTKSIVANKSSLSYASIAMVTYWPVSDVAVFSKKFNLINVPGIYVGTEGNSFFLRNYYKIEQMPYVALYSASGNLIKTWQRDITIKDLISKLQSLK